MDDSGQRDNGRHSMDFYNGMQAPWNMMAQYQMKESDAFFNKKIMHILSEKELAINELNRAISDKNEALEERNEAVRQRDEAIAARDTAIRERESAIAALRFQENTMNGNSDRQNQRGTKRTNHPSNNVEPAYNGKEAQVTTAIPISVVSSEDVRSQQAKRTKEKKRVSSSPKVSKSPKKGKKVGEDLNRHVTTDGSKAEWDAQDLGLLGQVDFDESVMAAPVCSCTGVARQCYKWGNGGWQSACCTTTLSVYPLPQLANKRRSRIGGRKMSGSVFSRLLTRLAADGHDLAIPVDLKNYWSKHGTNRYITIK